MTTEQNDNLEAMLSNLNLSTKVFAAATSR